MNRISFVVAGTILILSLLVAQDASAQLKRSDFVSDASHVIGTYKPAESDHSPASMASAAEAFLATLDDELRKEVVFAIDSAERRLWTNLPADPGAGGVELAQLSEAQLKALCDLMGALFSEQGYQKMCNIMLADDTLLRGGRPRPGFGTETFAVVIFGTPSTTEPWAFQLDGHHVGVNVSITGDNLTMSPSFIGTQPESFRLGSDAVRPLADGIDGAYELAGSMDDEQRKKAVVRPRRSRIQTGPGKDGVIPEQSGISCSEFSEEQKAILTRLIASWVNDMPAPYADKKMAEVREAMDELRFSWNGETEAGSDISWRLQGPSLIIEYACQDLGGNPLNHLHSMYRDPSNEYAGQLDK